MLVTTDQPLEMVCARDLPLLHQPHDYRVLQQQCGLGENELSELTLHRFAGILQNPETVTRAAASYAPHETIDRALLTPYNAQYSCASLFHTKICPLCLDAIRVCPQHNIPLIDQCPHCQASIPTESLLLRALGGLACAEEIMRTDSFRLLTTAVHLSLLHYLFACWPTHFLSFLNHLAYLLKGPREKGSLIDPPQTLDALLSWFHLDRPHNDPYLFIQYVLSRCDFLALWSPPDRSRSISSRLLVSSASSLL